MYTYIFFLTELNEPAINASHRARSEYVDEGFTCNPLRRFMTATRLPLSHALHFLQPGAIAETLSLSAIRFRWLSRNASFHFVFTWLREMKRRASDNIMVSSRHPSHVTRCFQVRRCAAFCSTTRPDCALKDLSGIRFQLLLREDIFQLHDYLAPAFQHF